MSSSKKNEMSSVQQNHNPDNLNMEDVLKVLQIIRSRNTLQPTVAANAPKKFVLKAQNWYRTYRTDSVSQFADFSVVRIPDLGAPVDIPLLDEVVTPLTMFNVAFNSFITLMGNPGELMSSECYITALTSIILNLGNTEHKAALAKSFYCIPYALNYVSVTSAVFVEIYLKPNIKKFKQQDAYDRYSSCDDETLTHFSAIFFGMMFILMRKDLSSGYSNQYFSERYQGLISKTEGVGAAMHLILDDYFPDKQTCETYVETVEGLHKFRRECLMAIRSISKCEGKLKTVCQKVLNYLRWSEMTHIVMIGKDLIGRCPAARSLIVVATEQMHLDNAFDYISTKHNDDLPYIKLLFPSLETAILNFEKFPYTTAAAQIVHSFFNKTSVKYKKGEEFSYNFDIVRHMERTIHSLLTAQQVNNSNTTLQSTQQQ